MNIVTCATANYVDKLVLLLSSARSTNPTCHIRIHCPGWTPELLQAARTAYPVYEFIPEAAPQDTASTVDHNKRSGDVLRYKPQWLHNMYTQVHGPVLWVDADTLLLRPLKPLIARVDVNGDYGVTHRPSAREFAKFAVAVLYFTRKPAAQRLLQEYVTLTLSNVGKGGWYHDQLALYEATQKFPARLVPLAEREHSIQGNLHTILLSRRT